MALLEFLHGFEPQPSVASMGDKIEGRLPVARDDDRLALLHTAGKLCEAIFCVFDGNRRHGK
jgi:hypothetical protein